MGRVENGEGLCRRAPTGKCRGEDYEDAPTRSTSSKSGRWGSEGLIVRVREYDQREAALEAAGLQEQRHGA